jgi:glycosyltransferase involved in cell wall biosynthesis
MAGSAVVVLVNLNVYLGGGETLMVRFAEYLKQKGVEFFCVCAEGGYAHKDLKLKGIEADSILPIESSPDYFYEGRVGRQALIDAITSKIQGRPVRFVSFCMRDLYTVRAACAELTHAAITHLILHIQDDLYLGQTITEKIVYRLTGRRHFGNYGAIKFNRQLLNEVNDNLGLICMADLIAKAWQSNFGIVISSERIVPLPSFVANPEICVQENQNRKIVWIGRLVDFKIPALLAMIDYLAVENEYSLTIIGDGDRSSLIRRMKERGVAEHRVNFVGEIPYSHLGEFIRGHSIGYAMGTSLIELARFRIPVVIALASYSHAPFSRSICGGLFFDQPKGCDGSDLAIYSEREIKTTIAKVISDIENDWVQAANACYGYALNNYAIEHNFSEYTRIIENTPLTSYSKKFIRIPTASLIRKLIYQFVRKNR